MSAFAALTLIPMPENVFAGEWVAIAPSQAKIDYIHKVGSGCVG